MQEKVFNKGEIMIRQGEFDSVFYQILSGSADVTASDNADNVLFIATLKAGEYFGEMSLLEGGFPHSATVAAAEDNTRVLEIPAEQLTKYFESEPEKIYALMKYLGNRIRSMTGVYEEALADLAAVKKDGSKVLGGKLGAYITYYTNTRKLNQVSVDTIQAVDHKDGYAKKIDTYPAGTVICREGVTGDCMYDIHWGKVGVYTGYGTIDEKKITELIANEFFGEMGMLEGAPRSATVVALEDTTVETITADDLAELFHENPMKVQMITVHIARRLKNLTKDYLNVCEQIVEAAKAE